MIVYTMNLKTLFSKSVPIGIIFMANAPFVEGKSTGMVWQIDAIFNAGIHSIKAVLSPPNAD